MNAGLFPVAEMQIRGAAHEDVHAIGAHEELAAVVWIGIEVRGWGRALWTLVFGGMRVGTRLDRIGVRGGAGGGARARGGAGGGARGRDGTCRGPPTGIENRVWVRAKLQSVTEVKAHGAGHWDVHSV